MIILLIVIGMIFLMAVFSYLYLYGIHPSFWVSPPDILWLLPIVGGYGGAAVLALLARWLLSREGTTLWAPPTLVLIAAAALIVALGVDYWTWHASGLRPYMSGQGAVVHAFLALQAMLTAIAALMALYLAARNSRGLVVRPRNNSFDLVVLFIAYTAAQGATASLLVRLFPGAL